jgi:hypothetical protein
MNGRWVVATLLGGTAVFGAIAWTIGLNLLHDAERRAEAAGARRLSDREAAEQAARTDPYGLPSRLDDAPTRNIELPWREGTLEHPLPADASGVAELFRAYEVSLKGCKPQLPATERSSPEILVYVTLRATPDGYGRVAAIDGTGEGAVVRAFTACLTAAMAPAVFVTPPGGETTIAHRVQLPR